MSGLEICIWELSAHGFYLNPRTVLNHGEKKNVYGQDEKELSPRHSVQEDRKRKETCKGDGKASNGTGIKTRKKIDRPVDKILQKGGTQLQNTAGWWRKMRTEN